MNYLAHALLSLDNEQIQLGNLIGDFVKGNKFNNYPEQIKAGILLHRRIDHFTDHHAAIREAVSYFKPAYRLSGGVFVDIVFDHFLANDDRYFTEQQLWEFTQGVYRNLLLNETHLNEAMKALFAHMSTHNWLYHYKQFEGLERAVLGICRRHPILGEGQEAIKLIERHFDALQKLYQHYFPQLFDFVYQNGKDAE